MKTIKLVDLVGFFFVLVFLFIYFNTIKDKQEILMLNSELKVRGCIVIDENSVSIIDSLQDNFSIGMDDLLRTI